MDLALYSKITNLMELKLQLIGELEDLLQAEVDLTILHGDMSHLLLHEILLKRKPLFVSRREILIERQIYAIKMYSDVPFITRYQDLSLQRNLKRFNLENLTGNYGASLC